MKSHHRSPWAFRYEIRESVFRSITLSALSVFSELSGNQMSVLFPVFSLCTIKIQGAIVQVMSTAVVGFEVNSQACPEHFLRSSLFGGTRRRVPRGRMRIGTTIRVRRCCVCKTRGFLTRLTSANGFYAAGDETAQYHRFVSSTVFLSREGFSVF